jgi:hypothetical protein
MSKLQEYVLLALLALSLSGVVISILVLLGVVG